MSERPIAQPVVHTSDGRRSFACFPAAILGLVIDSDSRFLLMSGPGGEGWQTIAGAIEAGESPLDALRREIQEEAGSEMKIRPLGAVHTFLYPYAPEVPAMLSIVYVAQYLGGAVHPGSDMAGNTAAWFTLDELSEPNFGLYVPEQPWLFVRAAAYAAQALREEQVQLEPWSDRRPWDAEGP